MCRESAHSHLLPSTAVPPSSSPLSTPSFTHPERTHTHDPNRCPTLDFPHDLEPLGTPIAQLDIRRVIIDPPSSITGLTHCLPALSEVARHTRCALLLTRSLRQPPADPLHASGPASPILEAVRSRLLLTADPTDDRHHLLLTTKHSFSGPASILCYEILSTDTGI